MKKVTYKDAGVDIEAGYESVERIKKHVKKTFNSNVISDLGGFGGMFELPTGYVKPVLISGTDGVGTKLVISQLMDKHDTIGIDCVAMCVNDIICQGAKPLYFLDYIACGKNKPKKIEEIVKGVAQGCIESGAALIGGETAEMPDMYTQDEYDIAGFAVGIVEKDKIITGQQISEGDIIIGIPSSGIHSNGFSLVRKLYFESNNYNLDQYIEEFSGTLGQTLLTPTKIYYNSTLSAIAQCNIKGISHITGGGFYENIPRVLPKGLTANIYKQRIPKMPIFETIQKLGNLEDEDMYSTFNMGIGLIMIVSPDEVDKVMTYIRSSREEPVVLGEITEGIQGVVLWP
ncbi:phosphoribosylformylglycinamidine cyclo-ligase [Alkalibaculum sp. M08DMB]|uniref:Phosphoribosylformylglycinamidine cyclo-ligase n=1 Tax=Alkalibaculum sporogenes TaxID=2655001 RepID=A0A6A7K648_9FIRM|nr:phosphoribosylformylglycinamidine cyclo-ligase [Alkalibaculum sporogenes]MPW24959.1 phosphoribosylformylglycinamidine cyclo-ligase [Alkalibaculum sporogenes]